MRAALAALVIGLLASCPIVCGTAHAGACGHDHSPPGADDRGRSDLPAPANDDDCVCNGAIKAADPAQGFAAGDLHAAPASFGLAALARTSGPACGPSAVPDSALDGLRARPGLRMILRC